MLKSAKSLQLPLVEPGHLPIWRLILQEAYTGLRNDIILNSITRVATATDYTAKKHDTYIGVTNTDAGRRITLPPANLAGEAHIIIVKDESGGAAGNNITVDGDGAETIDGAATQTISANYGVLRIIAACKDGTWQWFTI